MGWNSRVWPLRSKRGPVNTAWKFICSRWNSELLKSISSHTLPISRIVKWANGAVRWRVHDLASYLPLHFSFPTRVIFIAITSSVSHRSVDRVNCKFSERPIPEVASIGHSSRKRWLGRKSLAAINAFLCCMHRRCILNCRDHIHDCKCCLYADVAKTCLHLLACLVQFGELN